MAEKKFNKIQAVNNYVCLRVERFLENQEDWKENQNGIIMPKKVSAAAPQNEKYRVNLYVESIGGAVENPSFKVGDKVVANDYDMQFVSDSDDEDDENIWVLVKADQIKAVLD